MRQPLHEPEDRRSSVQTGGDFAFPDSIPTFRAKLQQIIVNGAAVSPAREDRFGMLPGSLPHHIDEGEERSLP
jgi:hypothetical protein